MVCVSGLNFALISILVISLALSNANFQDILKCTLLTEKLEKITINIFKTIYSVCVCVSMRVCMCT